MIGWHHGTARPEPTRFVLALVACMLLTLSADVNAQGVTTASISGSVHGAGAREVVDAFVSVVNTATGYATDTRSRNGRFFVQGLTTGGPYRILIRSVGYSPQLLSGFFLTLGEKREFDFTLVPVTSELDTVRVTAGNDRTRIAAAGGVATAISDSTLRRLPTLNRDMYDFVRLVPQAGTGFGLSGAGASFRFNSYVIDGVSDRQLQGNNVMGSGTTGGKSISLEAIKEYQVLISPYDARYGGFAGMLVNAVTKNGTNDFSGSAYGFLRNAGLARTNSFVGSSPFHREQFGFAAGGPVIRDRLHFFIAPEFQHSTAPTPGPFIDENGNADSTFAISPGDVARLVSLLQAKGVDAGTGGRVTSLNPATTLFGRLDLALPEWKSRVVLLDTYSSVDVTRFSRSAGVLVFPLSSNSWTLRTAKHSTAVQVFTHPSASIFNELVLARLDRPLEATGYTPVPSIQVNVVPRNGSGTATLIAGPPAVAGGTGSVQRLYEIGDHLTMHAGYRHTLGVGAHVEFFRYHAVGVRGSYGQWRFSSLDALASNDAVSYTITKDFGSAEAQIRGSQPSAYITDEWRILDALSLTLGLRADALSYSGSPQYNPVVDSVFHRNTSDYPATRVQYSPRIGFTWTPFADNGTRVRGGAGIFVGPPPLGWMLGPMRSDGAGVRTLTCSGASGSSKTPKFVADPAQQPVLCAGGRGFSNGPVALVDRNLKMAELFRSSLAIDRQLPWSVDATVEALYSRVRSDFLFVNANLVGPQGLDAHGRVLYGDIDPFGRGTPKLVQSGRFPEVFDLRNHSLGHSWSVTAQLSKPFSERVEARASYTWSRTRDVQSLTNGAAVAVADTWASGRSLSTRHDLLRTGVSSFEVPHRVVLAATYSAPWNRWKTDVSVYYIGESGSPFTFGDSTAGVGLGDLNADGTSANDPIYVPMDATDSREIVFDTVSRASEFEQFIRDTPCLARQRGAIVARNSCNGRWVNTSNLSLRQSLQPIMGRELQVQLEVFNVLNLLNSSWGQMRQPISAVLQHVGQTQGAGSQPIFHFDPGSARGSTRNLESGYQLQLSLRYSF